MSTYDLDQIVGIQVFLFEKTQQQNTHTISSRKWVVE